ncbi:MAG: transketolase [bacterium]|nr:transketolase [bacterium]
MTDSKKCGNRSKSYPNDKLCIDVIRGLAMDGPKKANSGHPGAAMALAPLGWTVFSRVLKHNPADPKWFNRDRFVISCGHASMLLYSLLHITGYEISLDDLKNFRQWGSITPGHPEYGMTAGVEMTTGPLGQGLSSAVGMALAERYLAAVFNRPDYKIIDHYTYVFCSDGDLMEGVTSEAGSLAGTLGLNKLIAIYDDNHITIAGKTDLAFTEERLKRYEAYGWHTQMLQDPNDLDAFEKAIRIAQKDPRPSIIGVRTTIAYPSPKMMDTSASHGTPFAEEEIAATKKIMGLPENEKFYIPEEVYETGRSVAKCGADAQALWQKMWAGYSREYPELAKQLDMYIEGRLPENWDKDLIEFEAGKSVATRVSSGKVINAIAKRIPILMGGSADLEPSTKTLIDGSASQSKEAPEGRNIHFGIREHGMGAVLNGMALHGAMIPYGATFLVFSDYMRGAVRLAALMGTNAVYVWTHDSIGLGEDGPTHQPVEHLAALRAIPNLTMIRPCDANEVAEAWKVAVEGVGGPVGLALTRQNVPTLDRNKYGAASGLKQGAYILSEASAKVPQVILIGTGSEVHICLEAQAELEAEGIAARVVSMPSWELFAKQSAEYRESVLPSAVTARVSVEAGSTFGWMRWVGEKGCAVGLDRFGASAPYETLYEKFALTASNVAAKAKELLH